MSYCFRYILLIILFGLNFGLWADNPSVAKFGLLDKELQIIEISGSRRISGVYPHLTTYSQSRKDGRFFKQGLVDQFGGEIG